MGGFQVQNYLTVKEILTGNLVIVNIEKEYIDSCSLKKFSKVAGKFEAAGRDGRSKMMLIFDGFNDDPREICEIDVIRQWVAKAFKYYPHMFYWLTPFENNNSFIIACLSDFVLTTFGERKMTVDEYLAAGYDYDNMPKLRLQVKPSQEVRQAIVSAIKSYGSKAGESAEQLCLLIDNLPFEIVAEEAINMEFPDAR